MPILPNEVKSFKAPTGGSPRGWTFISTGLNCWRSFFYRYIVGLFPVKPADALLLGSAYHLFHEGEDFKTVEGKFPGYALEAQKMFDLRMQKGPPMPGVGDEAVVVEKEFSIFGGLMTSKPDRIEGKGASVIVRDFKSAMTFSENDELMWNTDGGIIGECIAGKTSKAIVDIQKKVKPREDGSLPDGPYTKIVTVRLTDEKVEALKTSVEFFWQELEARVLYVSTDVNGGSLNTHFPKNLKGCVGKYGPCPYYARCWKRGSAESFLYKHAGPPRNWAKYKPAVKYMKALDKVAEMGMKL